VSRRNPFFERVRRSAYARALERPELRLASEPRQSPVGPVSAPVKMVDAATRALIDDAIRRRAGR
jgi:hypothetical protein